MALEGQLSDFNISEIFQLIASQQKSGFLNLESQQKMVFIFDKGVLISTRDRRSGSNDPLERYLRAYGFFDDAQWDHIEYIKNNSSLDLTEILVSEGLLETEELAKALRGVAQEMTFEGMKLKRGRYHFSSTRGTPQGIRGRVDLNVQGLLMEAARRLDDEPRLAELFSSPVMTFHRGKKSPESEELTPTDSRILKLALDGEPLGKIICQAQVDSFATRERLKLFCEMKYLEAVGAGESTDANQGPSTSSSPPERGTGLKSRFLTGTLTILLLGLGVVRWEPLVHQGPCLLTRLLGEEAGPVVKFVSAAAATQPAAGEAATPITGSEIRRRQIRDTVYQAAALYRYRYGQYPVDLSLLVKEGMMTPKVYRILARLGWTYRLQDDKDGYSLAP
jgi:hypothetical protein